MVYSSKNYKDIQANCSLDETLVRQDTFICSDAYSDDISFTDLYSHGLIEISMVLGGRGILRVLGQTIPYEVGNICIFNTNVPHRYFAAEEGERLTVRRILFNPKDWFEDEISSPSSSRFCYGTFLENPVTAYLMVTQRMLERVLKLCDSLDIERFEKKSEWRNAVKSYLSLIMISLERHVNTAIKNMPVADSATWSPVSAAIASVIENYGDPNLTLENIADSFYISKSYLSRLFKQITGEPFSDYLRKTRLANACSLLVNTEMTIDEIIKKCGMRDTYTFYKIFSSHTGMTPNNYRKINNKGEKTMSILTEISENLQKGKSKIVKELVQQAIDEGFDAEVILSDALLSGMSVIGDKFKNNEVFVPEVLVAARAMNAGAQLLKPLLTESGVTAKGKICIGTVHGDLHDIGKNLVKMMMEGKGLEVIDLGTDVTPETFVNTAIEQNCQVICCSALLTTTIGVMEDVVKAAEAAGIRDKVKIMVGGAPVTEDFCKKIGADCYTVDAASASDAAVAFCKA
ncbi:MAG: cobalamin-dependent protein [Clostridia bacterium]|nr:cobalamin-dependent protein [Clostridia bacterium]